MLALAMACGPLSGLCEPVSPTVDIVLIEKRQSHIQSGSATTVPAPADPVHQSYPYQFRVAVEGTDLGSLPAASFTIPASGTGGHPALSYSADKQSWEYRAGFGTQGALDTAYPNSPSLEAGDYSVTLSSATTSLSLAGDLYPSTPVVTAIGGNWSAGILYVDASQPLTLQTSSFAGFNDDGVFAHISLGLYPQAGNGFEFESFSESLSTFVPDAPHDDSVSHTFAGGDLIAGTTYYVEVEFSRIVDIASLGEEFPDTMAVAMYTTRTLLTIQTLAAIPEPGTYALIAGLGVLGAGLVMKRRIAA